VNYKFKDVWALKMPWAKPIFNEVGLVTFLKCHLCSKIEKRTRFWWLNRILLKGPSMIKYAKTIVFKKINFINNIFSTLTLKKILKII
jgi:hypothetical protein